jgi:hypothetical protein
MTWRNDLHIDDWANEWNSSTKISLNDSQDINDWPSDF